MASIAGAKIEKTIFQPYGPLFLVPEICILDDEECDAKANGSVSKKCGRCVWSGFGEAVNGVGCYIFALSTKKSIRPWYVGKTEKQSFAVEAWTDNKILIYKELLERHNGQPVLYLLVKTTPSGKLARSSKNGHTDITFLEKLLIGEALKENNNLSNIHHTKHLQTISVPGFLNSPPGNPTQVMRDIRKMLHT